MLKFITQFLCVRGDYIGIKSIPFIQNDRRFEFLSYQMLEYTTQKRNRRNNARFVQWKMKVRILF